MLHADLWGQVFDVRKDLLRRCGYHAACSDLAKIASEVKLDAMALAAVIEHKLKAAAPTR